MEEQSHDGYYWRLIHHLVVQERYVAFLVKSNEKEIWLEKEGTNETTVLRIVRRDFSWINYISRDLEQLLEAGEKVRKEMRSRQLNIINIYVSTFIPVDSYEDLLKQTVTTKNNRVKISSFMIDSEQSSFYGVLKLRESLQCDLPPFNISADDFEEAQRFRREVITISDQRVKQKQSLFTFGKPIFTYFMLIIVFIIFAVVEYFGSSTSLLTLVEFGAKYDPLIYEGEWWRFFTAIFLHIGFFHLFMNSLALYYLGNTVERIYGTKRFIVIYFIAGIFGSVSSFAFNSQVSAGASGAIFGCFGALLYFGVIHRKLFFRTMGVNVIVILLINLTLGFIMPMIDNGAHIGGLVGGFLAASFLHLPKHKKSIKQALLLLFTALSLVALLIFGFSAEEDSQKTHLVNVQIAQELLQRGDVEEAYPLLKAAVKADVDLVEANFLLAYSEAKLGLLNDAERNLLFTIEQRPLLHEAYFNLALVYYELRQYYDALNYVNQALEINPGNEDYLDLKEIIEKNLTER